MTVAVKVTDRNFFHHLGDVYHELFVSNAHPEVMRWALVNDGWQCFWIVLLYAMFVNSLGPRMMKNRKPFDLRWIMVPYNIFLVIVNFYIFYEYARIRWISGEEITCDIMYGTLDPMTNPETYRLAETTWYFYITKYIELIDTVFFVLRKKERQLSRLHLIHHTCVPILLFYMLRAEPGGYNSFFPLANAFVHTVMYTYYGISALGDDVTVHLKFKKYVTITQLIQFISVLYYFISRPFYGCHWSWVAGIGNLFIAGFFFVLFCNFYWNEYLKKQEESENAQQNEFKNGYKKHM